MSVPALPLTVSRALVMAGPHVGRTADGDHATVVSRPPRLSAHAARNEVRGARRRGCTVHVHRTTDRTGADTLVALVRHPEGTYDGVTYLVDVYEIPVNDLLDL
ncbi:hypothetical protein [Kitasatospora sp. NPDC088134]|uniref:hypothetical protein n=1 Tax=Kitasatospora sp. NPDC088134 TaxID=3364071 RepID=UPI003825266C